MKQLILLIIFIICISCKKSDTVYHTNINETLSPELYNKILEFQHKIKITKNSNEEINNVKNINSTNIYIYEIKFCIEGKDTIVGFALYSDGIHSYYNEEIQKNEKIYGIYEDDILKPTYINDPHKIGNIFIREYVEKPNTLSKFYKKYDYSHNDETYDIYLYKIKGKKLMFYDILKGNVHIN